MSVNVTAFNRHRRELAAKRAAEEAAKAKKRKRPENPVEPQEEVKKKTPGQKADEIKPESGGE